MATKYVTPDAAGGGDGSQGNPWTLPEARANVAAGDLIYCRSGTYTLGGVTQHFTANGTMQSPITWEVYSDAPGDRVGHALVDHNYANGQVLTIDCDYNHFVGLAARRSANTMGIYITPGKWGNRLVGCYAADNNTYGFHDYSKGCLFVGCEAYNNTNSGFFSPVGLQCVGCLAGTNGVDGFRCSGTHFSAIDCIAAWNSGAGFRFGKDSVYVRAAELQRSIAYRNGDDGVHLEVTATYPAPMAICRNVIIGGNSGWGVGAGGNQDCMIVGCVFLDQSSKIETATVHGYHEHNANLNPAGYIGPDLFVNTSEYDFSFRPGAAFEALREAGYPTEGPNYNWLSQKTQLYAHPGPGNIRVCRQANTTGNL